MSIKLGIVGFILLQDVVNGSEQHSCNGNDSFFVTPALFQVFIADHAAKGGMLGISKESWMVALEKENYLKAAEMSMEDDYGMIDGIINNGPKEDKTLDAKAPETGEKSSIMDRLKSAKTEKQKECCPPKKHKGEIEL